MTGKNEHLQQLNANNYSIIIMFNVNNVQHTAHAWYGETVALSTCRVYMRLGNFFVCNTLRAPALHFEQRNYQDTLRWCEAVNTFINS